MMKHNDKLIITRSKLKEKDVEINVINDYFYGYVINSFLRERRMFAIESIPQRRSNEKYRNFSLVMVHPTWKAHLYFKMTILSRSQGKSWKMVLSSSIKSHTWTVNTNEESSLRFTFMLEEKKNLTFAVIFLLLTGNLLPFFTILFIVESYFDPLHRFICRINVGSS